MAIEHVVHLTPSFGCGGLEKVIANLLHECSGDENVKHSIVSLSEDLSFAHALPENVEIHTVNKKEGLDLLAHYRVAKLLKKIKATILHTYNFGTLEYHSSAKVSGIKKHIHSDHGLGGDHPDGKNSKHNKFRKVISHLIDDYVVVSNDLKTWVVDTVGVDSKKVKVIFNGVPTHEKSALPSKSINKLNLLIVGRLVEVKNHQRLFDALLLVKLNNPELDIHCDVVGDGPLREFLEEKGNPLVTFRGEQKDVFSYIEKCDALILSSDYEAMPMTILEAMSGCRPVICPDVGGIRDFLSDDDAFIVKPKSTEALSKIITQLAKEDETFYSDVVDSAHLKVSSEFNVKAMSRKYSELYVIEEKPSKAKDDASKKPSKEEQATTEIKKEEAGTIVAEPPAKDDTVADSEPAKDEMVTDDKDNAAADIEAQNEHNSVVITEPVDNIISTPAEDDAVISEQKETEESSKK